MTTTLAFCVLAALLIAASATGPVIEQLQGEWSGPFEHVDIAIVTEDGSQLVCRDSLPPECEQEVPPGSMTVMVNGSTISFNIAAREGVLTPEDSAALFPGCAAAGITVPELVAVIQPMEIQSYDPATEHLTFIDTRRPDDINCIMASVQAGGLKCMLRLPLVK